MQQLYNRKYNKMKIHGMIKNEAASLFVLKICFYKLYHINLATLLVGHIILQERFLLNYYLNLLQNSIAVFNYALLNRLHLRNLIFVPENK